MQSVKILNHVIIKTIVNLSTINMSLLSVNNTYVESRNTAISIIDRTLHKMTF